MSSKRKIKDCSELPTWFDIRLYDAMDDAGPEQWALQLEARLMVYGEDARGKYGKAVLANGKYISATDVIRSCPIIGQQQINEVRLFEIYKQFHRSVELATRSDVNDYLREWNAYIEEQAAQQDTSSAFFKLADALCDGRDVSQMNEEETSSLELLSCTRLPVPIGGSIFLTLVDLELDDETLKTEFEIFLARMRKLSPYSEHYPRVTPALMKKWARYKVLAYLDLEAWANEKNTSIPNPIFARALFPTGSFGESHVKDTHRPTVDNFFSYYTLRSLQTMMQCDK